MRYLFILLVIFMAGCDQSGGNQATASTPAAAPVPTPEAATQPIATVVTPPNYPPSYTIEDDGEYGYQGEVSKNAADSGTAQVPLIMMRYLGEKDGTYTVAEYDGSVKVATSCKRPCEFMKVVTSVNGQFISKSILPTDGTLGYAVLADAINGYLKVYVKPRNHSQD